MFQLVQETLKIHADIALQICREFDGYFHLIACVGRWLR